MEWYWWVLAVLALTAFIFLKIKVGGAWLKKQKEKKDLSEKLIEGED
jgi:hypothetical protein